MLSFRCFLDGGGDVGDISIGTGVDLLAVETDSFLDSCLCTRGVSLEERDGLEEGSKLIGVPRVLPTTRVSLRETRGLGIEKKESAPEDLRAGLLNRGTSNLDI